MTQRLGLALATLAAGAGLLAAAALGSAAPPSPGILRVGSTGNLDSIDPAIAYGTTAWWFEFATRANLYSYPDKPGAAGGKLIPEVAKRFTVSRNGKVYRFFLKRTYRFSDGARVTALSFEYALERSLQRGFGSPGGYFVDGTYAVNIAGSRAFASGAANTISGVRADGYVLTVKLVRRDPRLLAILAMPFFQAASLKLPPASEVINVDRVGDLPTAGPYTWSFNDPNHRAIILRNPYYRGPRKHNLAGVEFDMRLNVNDCYNRTRSGDLDIGCVPPAEVTAAAQEYGVSRTRPVKSGRFWVKPTNCVAWLGFNYRRNLFANNLPLRRAVNWAVDRTALAAQVGPYRARPWTHVLPPGFPGSITTRRLQPYSVRPNLAKARELAQGHMGDGRIRVAYPSPKPALADLLRQALVGLGFDPARIQMVPYAGFNIEVVYSTDVVMDFSFSWCDVYYDPMTFFQPIFDRSDQYFASPDEQYRNRLDATSRGLTGRARLRALGKLDLSIVRNLAPVAPLYSSTDYFFFSARVAPSSLVFSPVYSWSIPALRLR